MAAYNSGPGTVQSAVKRTGYADFWELYRRNVLPKGNPQLRADHSGRHHHGQESGAVWAGRHPPEQPVPYDAVKIDYSVDLRLVAQCVDVSPATLQDLNPSLLRLTTPKDQTFELRLPVGTRDRYLAAIEPIPIPMRVWWRYHEVAEGDTLASIARTYRTTPSAIEKENHLAADDELKPDSKLIIPIPPGKHSATEDGASYARHTTRYKVRRGDTVQTVADNFSLPPTMIRRWNHLRGDSLRGRRIVYVHLPVTPSALTSETAAASKSKSNKDLHPTTPKTVQRHKVQPGETLVSIATTHHTTVEALKRDNGNLAMPRPGMVLVIKDVPIESSRWLLAASFWLLLAHPYNWKKRDEILPALCYSTLPARCNMQPADSCKTLGSSITPAGSARRRCAIIAPRSANALVFQLSFYFPSTRSACPESRRSPKPGGRMTFDETLYARDDEMDEFGDSGAYGDSLEEDYEEEEEEEEAEVPGMIEPQPEPATPCPPHPTPRVVVEARPPPRKPAA